MIFELIRGRKRYGVRERGAAAVAALVDLYLPHPGGREPLAHDGPDESRATAGTKTL